MPKKRLAILTSAWWKHSHPDLIAAKILKGYREDDGPGPDLDIVSVWIDAADRRSREYGESVCTRAGIPVFADAQSALQEDIDGILLLCNQGMQQPRPQDAWRAVFDFVENQHNAPVPVYSSKTISGPTFLDSKAAYDQCRKLGIPLMAFSAYVVAYRDNNLPIGTVIELAAAAGASNAANRQSFPHFGVHTLQCLQCQMERRGDGETGVEAVQCFSGKGMFTQFNSIGILDDVITALAPGDYRRIEDNLNGVVVLIDYIDGTLGVIAHLDGHYLPYGPTGETDVAFLAQGGPTFWPALFRSHMDAAGGTWSAVIEAIDRFMEFGRPPVPVERTLLTDGIMDAALRSRVGGGIKVRTPELRIAYPPADHKYLFSPQP